MFKKPPKFAPHPAPQVGRLSRVKCSVKKEAVVWRQVAQLDVALGRRHGGHAAAASSPRRTRSLARKSRGQQRWLRRGDRVDIDYHKEALFPTHAEGVGTACQALIGETGRKEAVIGHRRGRTALGCEGRSSRMPPAEIRRGQSNPAFPDACPGAASFFGGVCLVAAFRIIDSLGILRARSRTRR